MVKTLIFTLAILGAGRAYAERVEVNMDDPNLAYTTDYASDSAISCPKTLKGRALKACLAKTGDSANEEISDDADSIAQTATRSVH